MYQDNEVGGGKLEKNKFESSISELKKKTFVSYADIESYGEFDFFQKMFCASLSSKSWGRIMSLVCWKCRNNDSYHLLTFSNIVKSFYLESHYE